MRIKFLAALIITACVGLVACPGGNQQSDDSALLEDYDMYHTPDMAGISMEGSMDQRFSEDDLKWIYADLRMAIASTGAEYVPELEAGRLGADNQEVGQQNAKALQGQMVINAMNAIGDKYNLKKFELQELLEKGINYEWSENTKDLSY